MKAVLISIRPKWCEKIASGEKTVEIRKTAPKLQPPFKGYIYCTRNTPYNPVVPRIYQKENGNMYIGGKHYAEFLTGKVIGEFVCDKIFPIRVFENGGIQDYMFHKMEQSLVPYDDIAEYIGKEKTGYGWHISDLVIYDTPMDLSEFKRWVDRSRGQRYHEDMLNLQSAPQSWCYIEKA